MLTIDNMGILRPREEVMPVAKGTVIFRATITLKDGTVLKAKDYGHKAWPIYLTNGTSKKKRPKAA